jgi:hypothetical protein
MAFLVLRDVARTENSSILAKCAAARPPKNPEAPVINTLGILPKLKESNDCKNRVAIFRNFNFDNYGKSQLTLHFDHETQGNIHRIALLGR